jgi:hypothetical protein
MSVVTNIIVFASHADERLLSYVNRFFWNCRGLARIHEHAGGPKYLEAEVWVGAFNYLPMPDFVAHLKSLAWDSPAEVQLLVRGQEAELWSFVDLQLG